MKHSTRWNHPGKSFKSLILQNSKFDSALLLMLLEKGSRLQVYTVLIYNN